MRTTPIPLVTHDPKSKRATVHILPGDLLRSVYVVGKTGTGKSALLEHVIIGATGAGFGACVIDPHGELVDRVLGLIPKRDADRVVRFAPNDIAPVGLDLLAADSGESRALIASQIVEVFRKLWGPMLFGPRSEHLLRNSILVLLANPGTTLPCLTRLLVDESYREKLLVNVTDPVVRLFWSREFAGYGRNMQAEVTAPVLNKLGALTSPAVRRVVGQARPRLRMRQCMDEGRIVVADLSGIGRDAAQLLGALLVSSVAIAAYGRAGASAADRRPFLLVADEFQGYTTSSLPELLAEGRKFGLAAVLAHQFTHQLPKEILAGVLGNAGTLIAFRVSAEDAGIVEPELGPEITAARLVRLGRHRVAIKLLVNGEPLAPMICRTLPPEHGDPRERDKRIRASRERYGRIAERVDREIQGALGLTSEPRAPPPSEWRTGTRRRRTGFARGGESDEGDFT